MMAASLPGGRIRYPPLTATLLFCCLGLLSMTTCSCASAEDSHAARVLRRPHVSQRIVTPEATVSSQELAAPADGGTTTTTPVKKVSGGQRFSNGAVKFIKKFKSPIKFTKTGRQLFMFLDILTDVAMLAVMGLPFLGLVSLGALLFGPHLGLTMGNSAAGRRKRSWFAALLPAKPDLSRYLTILVDALRKYDAMDL